MLTQRDKVQEMTTTLSNEETLLQLQKRARRRLVGAVVLVLFAVGILWNLLDSIPPAAFIGTEHVVVTRVAPEMDKASDSNAVIIASEAVSASRPTVLPAHNNHLALRANDSLNGNVLPDDSAGPLGVTKPVEATLVDQATTEQTPSHKDPQRILEGVEDNPLEPAKQRPRLGNAVQYRIQVAAYSDAANAQLVVDKLRAVGLRVSSERVDTKNGGLTRVRIGPYASKIDAESALKKMQAHGVNGTLVAK